jgi:hypothetical protein
MDVDVPYLPAVGNVPKILDQIQHAGVPEVFNLDFLKDLGFNSSQDRPMVRVLKYLGMLDPPGRPQTAYREFVDQTKAKKVLASRLRAAFDDLFLADKQANTKSAEALKGWFKSKTGASDAVAKKMATTFKALTSYADFSAVEGLVVPSEETREERDVEIPRPPAQRQSTVELPQRHSAAVGAAELGFVYRIEIHLPDTQNIETFRAIFRAIREELTL